MSLLKYEMRTIFEKNLNYNIIGPQAILDNGILKQIAYLSFLNPNVFPNLDWKVLCVKSSASKRKLYSYCTAKENIENCAAALIFYNNSKDSVPSKNEYHINLLEISIMYSCLVNQVDYEILCINNSKAIKEYFKLPEASDIQAIITLGYYKNANANLKKLLYYEEAVKEV